VIQGEKTMKIRRFAGPDMRDAMRQVREALGADAVILETSRTATGVEISAAVDGAAGDGGSLEASRAAAAATYGPRGYTSGPTPEPLDGPAVRIDQGNALNGGWYQPPRAPNAATASELDEMREEMRSIRSLLEAQLGRLLWDEQARQSPATATLLRHYTQLGLDHDVARRLADRAAIDHPVGGWTAGLRTLVEQLPIADCDVVADGGVFAVIGPTGVGKTTSIAKLAARAAVQFGPEAVGLVTTDTFRVAAREQLETFGQIMGVTVASASDSRTLAEALASMAGRRLILVDTAGMSQRDPKLPEQLARLAADDCGVSTLLALPATTASGALQEIVDVFRTARPAGCILTKTDEATSLGGAFSVLIRSGLPLAYVANGQRVPEDLHLMRNRQSWLAKMAVELMRRESRVIDADTLSRRLPNMLTPEGHDVTDQAEGLRRQRTTKPVKVIAVTSGKGGVGKTNICANLAISMSMLGRRVMLLDADLGLANVDVLLGLQPAHSLADVVSGERRLQDVIVTGPAGVRVIPGASGLSEMADLTPAQHAGIVHAFSELTEDLDALLVDTAAGISEGVLRFCEAANEVLVVVCDEPTSITDAYALIKVLSTERNVSRFRVITNMTHQGGDGRSLFEKLLRVTERFLQVTLDHAGSVPYDDRVWRAVQLQTPFVTAFPASLAAGALKKLAHRADNWEGPRSARGNIEFFVERLLRSGGPAGREHAAA
jgi:flagellar biosynthesis protein FlhG